MRTLCLVALVAGLSACNSKKAAPTPTSSDCAAAIATMRRLSSTSSKDRIAAISKRCTADAWSPQASACLAGAKSTADLARCFFDHLTAAQRQKLDQDLDRFLRDPTPAEIEQRLTKLESVKNAMCACTDTACAQRVSDEMTRWSLEVAKTGTRIPNLTGERKERAMRIGEQTSKCMQAAMTTAPAITDAQRYVAKNAEFKDCICACTDIECGEAAAAALTKWSEDFLAHPTDNSTMNASDQARMETIENDVHACLRALRAAARH